MDRQKVVSTSNALRGIILAIAILIIAQTLSISVGEYIIVIGGSIIGNTVAGIAYTILALLGVKLCCTKILKLSLEDCKVTEISLRPLWIITAVSMPCLVIGAYMLCPGRWEQSILSCAQIWSILSGVVFFYGIGTGIVEEIIFRGVIMSLLEYRYNKIVAILVPSILFGSVHIIGNDLDFISTVQLVFAGSFVGILFSLVTYESGNIWNSALIHAVWNAIIGMGIVHIGIKVDENAIYNYVLTTESFTITGGDFGIEASIISVVIYVIFAILALCLIMRRGSKN